MKGPAVVVPLDGRGIWFIVKIGEVTIGPDAYQWQGLAQAFADEVNQAIEKYKSEFGL